jgi:transposase
VSAVLRADDGPAQPAAGAALPIAAARIPSKGSTRSVAWRAADSLAVRRFVGLGLDVAAPDHSTISRTRRLIAVETHRAVFTWVQARLVTAGLLTGQTVAIDATTLEANAAMRSIVRRDTGERYQEFLTRLAAASSLKTPTREALARLDRRRKKRTSNQDWQNPFDPDAKITKMKDGRASGARGRARRGSGQWRARGGDTAERQCRGHRVSSRRPASPRNRSRPRTSRARHRPRLAEIVADKGYHSNQTMIDLATVSVRSYIAEPDRGRRHWTQTPVAQAPIYGNRRRIRGVRGTRLMRRRGEYVERSFAHVYDTGGLRRTHLRGHQNILKRLLVHAGAFNLGLLMRQAFGRGTPRGCKNADLASVRLKSPSPSSARAPGRPPCVCCPPQS